MEWEEGLRNRKVSARKKAKKELKEEIKPVFKPKDNKFNFEENYNFGLGDISEVTDAIILMELNVDEACQKLLINKEETELIKLIYAREFFSKGEIKLGEKFSFGF